MPPCRHFTAKNDGDLADDRRAERPTSAIECKWSAAGFDPANLVSFRAAYPKGENLAVARDVTKPFSETHAGLRVDFVGLDGLLERLGAGALLPR